MWVVSLSALFTNHHHPPQTRTISRLTFSPSLPSPSSPTRERRDILESAPKSLGKDASRYTSGLTDLELSLFASARTYAALRVRWRRRQAETMESAGSMVASKVVAAASLPLSRGQKRDRSLLSAAGT